MYMNEKIGKATIKWNGGSLTTSCECQFVQEQVCELRVRSRYYPLRSRLVVGFSIFVFRCRIFIRDHS